MNRLLKKALAVALSLAMVVSTLASFAMKVDAATLSDNEKTSIAGNGPMTNLSLNADTEVYPACAEGSVERLNDGSMTTGHCALSQVGWGYSGEGYAIIALDTYYQASCINEIIVTYKDMNDNDTVVGRTYNIQTSVDKNNWTTIHTSNTITASDLADDKATVDKFNSQSNPTLSGTVRYIKVDFPEVATYGIQITEIAVLSSSPVEDPMGVTNPSSVTATGQVGHIKFNITPASGQSGYKYMAYLDSVSGTLLNNDCSANTDYSYEVPAGNHTVFVRSVYNEARSTGISSNSVTVSGYEDQANLINTAGTGLGTRVNFAYDGSGTNYTISNGSSVEGNGSITNGTIATGNSDYVTDKINTPGTWMNVDLGTLYRSSSFETVIVWFRSDVPGTWPENGGLEIQYSPDNENWTTVSEISQSEFNSQRTAAPFGIKADVSNASGTVRYVRVYFPNGVGYGPQITEMAVFDVDGDAQEASHETVVNPDNFTATASDYNTITGTITGATGHNDYTYDIYLNGSQHPVLSNLSAGSYTISCLDAGTYSVTCKAEHNSFYSSGLTVSNVSVANGFTYSRTFEAGLFPDSNANGNNYISQNGKTVYGVTASSDSTALAAGDAIDTNAGTRWASDSSDPHWLLVDLGSVKSVKEIDIWWETASSKDFSISLSTDGTTFRDVAYKNNAEAGENRRDVFELVQAINARYIKFNCKTRTTGYGHSIWEIAVYGATPTHTVTVDGVQIGTAFDGAKYKLPNEGEEQYAPYGYFLSTNHESIYKPGGEVTVNSNISFTGIRQITLTHKVGASVRMIKNSPGLSFGVNASVNNDIPEILNSMKFGMILCPFDIFVEKYDGNLILDNSRDQAHVEMSTESDWADYSTGLYRVGIKDMSTVNFTRDFTSRAYVKINYVDGTTNIVYAENPYTTDDTANVRKRNLKQVAQNIKDNAAYYNSLSADEKAAIDYFAQ